MQVVFAEILRFVFRNLNTLEVNVILFVLLKAIKKITFEKPSSSVPDFALNSFHGDYFFIRKLFH